MFSAVSTCGQIPRRAVPPDPLSAGRQDRLADIRRIGLRGSGCPDDDSPGKEFLDDQFADRVHHVLTWLKR